MHQNKPVLSEVINFERDIAPYPLTMIYAGVGSGKSTFAELLMNGSGQLGIPAKVVLLITSRKAKVIETLRGKVRYLNDRIQFRQNLLDNVEQCCLPILHIQ